MLRKKPNCAASYTISTGWKLWTTVRAVSKFIDKSVILKFYCDSFFKIFLGGGIQVMHSKEWLTIDDWLECGLRLCPLQIKHESRLENSDPGNLMVCFASTKIGGQVLGTGCSQVLHR